MFYGSVPLKVPSSVPLHALQNEPHKPCAAGAEMLRAIFPANGLPAARSVNVIVKVTVSSGN